MLSGNVSKSPDEPEQPADEDDSDEVVASSLSYLQRQATIVRGRSKITMKVSDLFISLKTRRRIYVYNISRERWRD